jgi:thiosulfate/3-mercaptopyruvate sulfurtransferase
MDQVGRRAASDRNGCADRSSIPVYWEDLLDAKEKTFKPADELRAIYEAHGILPSQQVIAYCLVGMRASVDLFALQFRILNSEF